MLYRAIKQQYPAARDADFSIVRQGGAEIIEAWDPALGAQPEPAAVLAAYDPLPDAKADKIRELRKEATTRVQAIYSFIDGPDWFVLIQDLYLSIKAQAREPLSGNLLALKGVRDEFDTKRAEIGALSTVAEVEAYDVGAGW